MPVETGEWEEEVPVAPPVGPANLGSTSPGPGSETPLDEDDSPILEPHPETQVEMSGPESDQKDDEETESIPEFDPKFRQDFEGLLYLGALTESFTWMGHSFTIRTLTSGEVIEVGLLHRPYIGTLSDVKAYQAAVVAACVTEVDGQPMPLPITNATNDTQVLNRFRYVMRSWFPPVLDKVYEQYLLLESRVEEVIDQMGEARG